jgi:hypothetical protein
MYYPKSEIVKVAYTTGGEFLVKGSSFPYTGDYYITNDGKIFSGKEYTSTTKELVRSGGAPPISNRLKAYEFHYAQPTQDDYNKGFFTRYVIKRVNSGFETIIEVSKEEYDRSSRDPLYIGSSFTWKITGPLYDDLSNPNAPVYGIYNTNDRTVKELDKKIKGAKDYFTNLTQYAI